MPRITSDPARSGNASVRRLHLPAPGLRSLEGCEVAAEYLQRVDTRVLRIDDGSALRARIARVGEIRFWHVAAPAMEMRWPASEGSSRVLFLVCIGGAMAVSPLRRADRSASSLVVIPASGAGTTIRFTASRNEFIAMSVPDRDPSMARGPVASSPKVPADVPRPFVGFIDGITAVGDAENLDASPLHSASRGTARSLIELAGAGMTDERCIVTRATDIILEDFADPELTTPRLAARLGVSVRTLQAAFAREGLTARAVLRDVRGRAARVARRAHPHATAMTIARASGFGSESAMFRALRELSRLGGSTTGNELDR